MAWNNYITFNVSGAGIDLTDFPVMIPLASASGLTSEDLTDIFTKIGSSSLKMKIEDKNLNQLYIEVDVWDDINERAWVFTKIPNLPASGADFTLYYDSSEPDNTQYVGTVGTSAAQAVWDSGFTHVFHLKESSDGTADEFKDSTQNENHGFGGGTVGYPTQVDSLLGKGQRFGSSPDGQYIRTKGLDPDGRDANTVEAFFKTPSGSMPTNNRINSNESRKCYQFFF